MNRQPSFNQRPWVMWFFWIFIILSKFFITPLIIATMLEHLAKEFHGSSILTDLQRNWQRFEVKLAHLHPIVQREMPTSPARRRVWMVVEHPSFSRFFIAVILINTLLMTAESYDADPAWVTASYWINLVFIVLYVVEQALKLFAQSVTFFSSAWNAFDFSVTVVSVVEVLAAGGGGVQALRVLRLFRIFRTLRILRSFPTLHVTVQAISSSASAIFATFVLTMIFTFVFAVIGAQFFAGVKHGPHINDYTNMHDVLSAMLLLFQVATQTKIAGIIADAGIEAPLCTECKECYLPENASGEGLQDFTDCSSRAGALLFFDVYCVGITVLKNLFVAVLIESYFAFTKELQFVLSDKHLDSFRDQWLLVDPCGTGQVSVWKLRRLLEGLHLDANPMGSCGLTDSISHRALRMQILEASREQLGEPAQVGSTAQDAFNLESVITFAATARVLALTVAGSKALPFEEMIKRRESLNFFAQGSLLAGIVHRLCRQKFRRNVYLNRLLSHGSLPASPGGVGDLKEALEPEICSFYLADDQGVVTVDPHNRRLSMLSFAGDVGGQVALDDIVRVSDVSTGRLYESARDDSRFSTKSGGPGADTADGVPSSGVEAVLDAGVFGLSVHDARAGREGRSVRASRRSDANSQESVNVALCARIECTDGQALEVWLKDARQCMCFIAVLRAYMSGHADSNSGDKGATPPHSEDGKAALACTVLDQPLPTVHHDPPRIWLRYVRILHAQAQLGTHTWMERDVCVHVVVCRWSHR